MKNENQDPAALVEKANAAIQDFQNTQAELEKEIKELATKTGADVKEAVERANSLAERVEGLANQIVEIEQEQAENVQVGRATIETLGQMVVASDEFKAYAAGNSGMGMKFQANTIIGQEGSPLENSDTIVAPQRAAGIVPGAFRKLRLRDVLLSGVTNSNAFEYVRELAWTNNAAETNEGTSKPESDLTFELVTANVKTIAHYIKASKQVLSDAPALQSYIDTRMRYGVEYRIDQQLLTGDGTNPNLSGLTDTGNHTAFTPITGENGLDSINRGIYAVEAADYAATAIIMNPSDWGALERLKVGGSSDERYIVGNPTGILGPMLWGLPVVTTNAMTQGKFLVGAMDIAAQVWNREGVVVEMFEQDGNNVTENLLTIRAEARCALAIYRPASLQYGSLTA
jgi:HK97 family phage major capsid protein